MNIENCEIIENHFRKMGLNKVKAFISVILITVFWLGVSYALELTFQDTSAGVNVAPVFSLSLDKAHIDFGYVQPGEKEILYEGSYFNEITCRSNHGLRWQLKVHLLGPIKHSIRNTQVPPENFRWKVIHTAGDGQVSNERQFNEFKINPALIYTGAGTDNFGKEVTLQFQYELEIPKNSLAGSYNSVILFTLTEVP